MTSIKIHRKTHDKITFRTDTTEYIIQWNNQITQIPEFPAVEADWLQSNLTDDSFYLKEYTYYQIIALITIVIFEKSYEYTFIFNTEIKILDAHERLVELYDILHEKINNLQHLIETSDNKYLDSFNLNTDNFSDTEILIYHNFLIEINDHEYNKWLICIKSNVKLHYAISYLSDTQKNIIYFGLRYCYYGYYYNKYIENKKDVQHIIDSKNINKSMMHDYILVILSYISKNNNYNILRFDTLHSNTGVKYTYIKNTIFYYRYCCYFSSEHYKDVFIDSDFYKNYDLSDNTNSINHDVLGGDFYYYAYKIYNKK